MRARASSRQPLRRPSTHRAKRRRGSAHHRAMISPLFQKYRPRWSWRVRGRGCRGRGVGTPSRGRAGQGTTLPFASPLAPMRGSRRCPAPSPARPPLLAPSRLPPRDALVHRLLGRGEKKGKKGVKGDSPSRPGSRKEPARGGEGRAAVPGWQPPAPPAPPGQRAPYPESFPIFTKLNTSIHAAGQLCPSLTHSSSSSSSSMSGEGCVQRQQQPSPKRQPAAAAAATPLRQGAGRAASRRS